MIRDVIEAVRHARRHDHDIARANRTAIAALENTAAAWSDREPYEFGFRRKIARVVDVHSSDERAAAGDDVKRLGHFAVRDRGDRRPRLRRSAVEDADPEPIVAEIGDLDLTIRAGAFRALMV